MLWTPRTDAVMSVAKFSTENVYGSLPLDGITAISFASGPQSINIQQAQDLVSVSAPNANLTSGAFVLVGCPSLTTLDFGGCVEISGPVTIQNCPALTSLDLSSFQFCYDDFVIFNTGLTSVDLSSLEDIYGIFQIGNSAALTTINWGNEFVDNGQDYYFNNNALTASVINAFLAHLVAEPAYVSGTVLLNGGTNAAPSGQGIVDKATLIGRGVVVNTN
jgi:hypothetical protein